MRLWLLHIAAVALLLSHGQLMSQGMQKEPLQYPSTQILPLPFRFWVVVTLLSIVSAHSALPLPKGFGLDSVLGEPAELLLQLADLGRFEDQHNDHLGWHARNIMAVAPEVCIYRVSNFHCAVQLLYLYIKSIC